MKTDPHINQEGDLVLIHYQDKATIYARIEAIKPDMKKDWFQVTLLLLTLPAKSVTWILREEYINGTPFTMGGEPMKLEGIPRDLHKAVTENESQPSEEKGRDQSSKVIPFKKQ